MGTVRRALIGVSLLLTLASAPVLAALGVLLGAAVVDLAALSGLMQPSDLTTQLLGYVRAHPLLVMALIAALQLGVLGMLGLNALGGAEPARGPGQREA